MSQIHHIKGTEEIYNLLVDYIVDVWKRVYPDLESNHYDVSDMIDHLATDAKAGIDLRDRLAQQANHDINQDFATMNSMMNILGRYCDDK